jgi:N-acetylmuramoyl-L-alanine amidase
VVGTPAAPRAGSARPSPPETPIALASLPLRPGSTGDDVADLQRRLRAAGYPIGEVSGEYDLATRAAVAAFQSAAGLDADGDCDADTWSALVESSFTLGMRLLCLRSPMMRGDDVSELQLRLGALGFDAGRVDGIFGQMTQSAVGDFQRNAGLVSDEVCGPETIACLRRLEGRGGSAPVTGVRERERLRRRVGSPTGLRVAIGSVGTTHPVLSSLAAELQLAGLSTLLLTTGWSEQAGSTNEFEADVYIGLVVADDPVVETSYFSVPGYESSGGRHLAQLILRELPAAPGWAIGVAAGKRLPILRETRPPAVLVKLGDAAMLETNQDLVVASLVRALDSWAAEPC